MLEISHFTHRCGNKTAGALLLMGLTVALPALGLFMLLRSWGVRAFARLG